jgi:hypothetical protein
MTLFKVLLLRRLCSSGSRLLCRKPWQRCRRGQWTRRQLTRRCRGRELQLEAHGPPQHLHAQAVPVEEQGGGLALPGGGRERALRARGGGGGRWRRR